VPTQPRPTSTATPAIDENGNLIPPPDVPDVAIIPAPPRAVAPLVPLKPRVLATPFAPVAPVATAAVLPGPTSRPGVAATSQPAPARTATPSGGSFVASTPTPVRALPGPTAPVPTKPANPFPTFAPQVVPTPRR